MFFAIISLYVLIDPWGEASLDPRDMIGRIYVRDNSSHCYTKYTCISFGPHEFRDFLFILSRNVDQMSRDMRFPTMWYVRQQRLRPACAYAKSNQGLY